MAITHLLVHIMLKNFFQPFVSTHYAKNFLSTWLIVNKNDSVHSLIIFFSHFLGHSPYSNHIKFYWPAYNLQKFKCYYVNTWVDIDLAQSGKLRPTCTNAFNTKKCEVLPRERKLANGNNIEAKYCVTDFHAHNINILHI